MPRRFSNAEKAQIRDLLMEAGEKLFSAKGLRKVTVDDLARASGISKGAFYAFFPSKEDLMFEIMEDSERLFRNEVALFLTEESIPPRERVKVFFERYVRFINRYVLLKTITEEDMAVLKRKIAPERLQAHFEREDKMIMDWIKDWQSTGKMSDVDPQAVLGLFKAVLYMGLHVNEMGSEVFNKAMQLFAKILSEQLVIDENIV